jgi:3-hydroxybutyryl-CoA dehydrogenase
MTQWNFAGNFNKYEERVVAMIFTKIGIVGVGTMGRGIAEMIAVKGLDVYIVEQTAQKLDQALQMI